MNKPPVSFSSSFTRQSKNLPPVPLAIAHSSPIGIQWYRWAAVAQKTLRFGRVGVKKRIEQDRTKVAVAEADIAWIKNSALIFVPIAASVLGIVAVFWWH